MAVLDRDDRVLRPVEDERRDVDAPGIDVGHVLVVPHLEHPGCLFGLGTQQDVPAPTLHMLDVGLRVRAGDESLDRCRVVGTARVREPVGTLAAAGGGGCRQNEAAESVRVASGRVLHDGAALRFAGENAAVDAECIEDTDDIAGQVVDGDQRRIDRRLTGAPVVVGDASPAGLGQEADRLLPHLPAAGPPAGRDEGARAVPEHDGVEPNAVDVEEHAPSFYRTTWQGASTRPTSTRTTSSASGSPRTSTIPPSTRPSSDCT